MKIKTLGIELPDEPVDGYVLEFYVVTQDTISKVKWTYYVRATYAEFVGDPEAKGAMIVDDWMTGDGRIGGWDAPKRFFDEENQERWRTYFSNPDAARSKFLEHLHANMVRREADFKRAADEYFKWTLGKVTCKHCGREQELRTSYQRCSTPGCELRYINW